MTIEEALHAAISHAHARFIYIKEAPDDKWKQLEEFEADGGGDCEDWCAACIEVACRNTGSVHDEVSMVIGDTPDGRHAWISVDNDRIWFEPTPGYPIVSGKPWVFHRTPLYKRRFVQGVGFIEPKTYVTENYIG